MNKGVQCLKTVGARHGFEMKREMSTENEKRTDRSESKSESDDGKVEIEVGSRNDVELPTSALRTDDDDLSPVLMSSRCPPQRSAWNSVDWGP